MLHKDPTGWPVRVHRKLEPLTNVDLIPIVRVVALPLADLTWTVAMGRLVVGAEGVVE